MFSFSNEIIKIKIKKNYSFKPILKCTTTEVTYAPPVGRSHLALCVAQLAGGSLVHLQQDGIKEKGKSYYLTEMTNL